MSNYNGVDISPDLQAMIARLRVPVAAAPQTAVTPQASVPAPVAQPVLPQQMMAGMLRNRHPHYVGHGLRPVIPGGTSPAEAAPITAGIPAGMTFGQWSDSIGLGQDESAIPQGSDVDRWDWFRQNGDANFNKLTAGTGRAPLSYSAGSYTQNQALAPDNPMATALRNTQTKTSV